MNPGRGNNMRVIAAVTVMSVIAIGVAVAFWSFGSVSHLATGEQQTTFEVDCEFDKFRQIMVRKNATAAIIGRSGMTLLDEQIHDMEIDTRQDDRPLLNALRGKSKSEVDAVKQITVRLVDPAIDADQLVLRQRAQIDLDSMHVETESKSPAGNLEDYRTALDARRRDERTEIRLTVALKVRVDVPKIFVDRADAEVQQSADDAIAEQQKSIEAFIAEHADKRLILPELGGTGRTILD